MARCYSGAMQNRQSLPQLWLLSDARNDAGLEQALRRLPRGSGFVLRHYHLPPAERRGLVLLDPAYEFPGEWERAAEGLVTAWRRWPTGGLALWYPLLAHGAEARLHRSVEEAGLRKVLRVELRVRPADSPAGMNGSGLLLVNPPWRLDEELAQWLPWLRRQLAPQGQGGESVDWLVPE